MSGATPQDCPAAPSSQTSPVLASRRLYILPIQFQIGTGSLCSGQRYLVFTHLTSVSMNLGLGVPDAPAPPPPPALALDSKPVLDPGNFQNKWSQLALSSSQECSLTPQGAASLMNPQSQSLIRHMQSNYIQCIASGGQPPNYKFFFYGQKAGDAAFYLVECNVNTASSKAQLKIKADDGTTAEAFSTLFQSMLSEFGHS